MGDHARPAVRHGATDGSAVPDRPEPSPSAPRGRHVIAQPSEGRAPRTGSPTARGTTAGRTDPTMCGAGAEGHSLIHIVLLDIDHRWLAW
jgi:hypothetical protein